MVIIVAHAPRNISRRIPTLAELESDAKAAIMVGEVRDFEIFIVDLLNLNFESNVRVDWI